MISKKYENLAQSIVQNVGGLENIVSLTHCVTRLRFCLKDDNLTNQTALEELTEVLAVVRGNGQYQVVIGNMVEDVFDTILSLYPIKSNKTTHSDEMQKTGNIITRALNQMSAILLPIVTALAGAGMIKAFLVILTVTFDILDTSGSTYKILNAAGNSVFYFLPLFLAVSSAKAFKCNPYISLAIVAALLEPNFTSLIQNVGDVVDFIGIPVVMMKYTGTLIPAILAILVYAKLERWLKTFIPKSIEIFALSFIALIIMLPLTAMVIGPVGVLLANGMGDFVNFVSTQSGLLTGMIIGGGWTLLVMFGIHWGVAPIMVNNISTYGFDYIRPMVAAATFASSGAAFGVFLRSRNKKTKAFALSTMVPALLGGITEPIIYGISLRYKRPFIAQIIGGAVAGGFIGAMHTKAIVYVFPALTTLPAFAGDTFIYYCIGILISFTVTALLTYLLGFEEQIDEPKENANIPSIEQKLYACAKGELKSLEHVNDPVFSSKAMGEGVAILPSVGELYAPIDSIVDFVFPTGHAIGLNANGTEILLHVGINTVEMNGKGFKVLVKEGQKVKCGEKLLEFDINMIKEAGYDYSIMQLISNMDQVKLLQISEKLNVTEQDSIITFKGR
ncbi:beta-glucoside-specific PTS transporter subunit IIABC [Lonepinella koalarum]|uniref:PTS system beta-glucosides-specific IIC component n=1 Tax=Lonepinella koalarum TaxID=53417 RepID=A0A4R1KVH3_9PAST|nr:beta-glucoside-specific PTS transporter subunit IIABC [Lonepinella koalarum]MDH2927568.1 PTS beta-glucoside transporter subunit EIIBCA [Lonepinella koalarum]TCK68289.1 PTS system beta-glucosides-specific IIC component [Lonepinella koalarum]TFJ89547.1 PTS beta-glucoside transporter subunit EIIBCA [Lonepinella koalarum]